MLLIILPSHSKPKLLHCEASCEFARNRRYAMFYCCIFEENKLAVENKLNQYRQGHFAPLSAFCNKSRHSFRAFFKVVYMCHCGQTWKMGRKIHSFLAPIELQSVFVMCWAHMQVLLIFRASSLFLWILKWLDKELLTSKESYFTWCTEKRWQPHSKGGSLAWPGNSYTASRLEPVGYLKSAVCVPSTCRFCYELAKPRMISPYNQDH